MTISAAERLRRFYARFSGGDHVLIPINADPDAIASAMAVKRLLWRRVSSVTITNINIIKRPDNILMVRLLDVDLVHIEQINNSDFNRYVIVDAQPDHHEYFSMFRPDVIIDHHPVSCDVADYADIRPEYGATASIMTEYLKAAKIKPSVKLATGLFYAIKTDTNNFKRQTLIEDVRAFQFLYKYANMHLDQRIEQAEINPEFLKYFTSAIRNRVQKNGKIFVHLGTVSSPDICVLIADFFMTVSSITWSVVAGYHDKKLIIIIRNDGIRRDAGKLAKRVFGRIGSAGGHKSMARAEIFRRDLKKHIPYNRQSYVLKWIINQIG